MYTQFESRWKLWNTALEQNDPNAPYYHLLRIVEHSVYYDLILSCWKYCEEHSYPVPHVLLRFISLSYFHMHLVSIRRLVDGSPLEGVKSVTSLVSILKDIEQHVDIFTRENLLKARGIDYAPPDKSKELAEFHREKLQNGESCYFIPHELAPDASIENCHAGFDLVSEVSPENRSRTDKAALGPLRALRDGLENRTEAVVVYCNKHITHLATREDRATVKQLHPPSTTTIWAALEALCVACNTLKVRYLDGSFVASFLATPVYDGAYLGSLDSFCPDNTCRELVADRYRTLSNQVSNWTCVSP